MRRGAQGQGQVLRLEIVGGDLEAVGGDLLLLVELAAAGRLVVDAALGVGGQLRSVAD